MQKRSSFEIKFLVLELLSAGSLPISHVMYKTYTSFELIKTVLRELEFSGLIIIRVREEGANKRRDVELTSRGFEAVNKYKELMSLMNGGVVIEKAVIHN